MRYERGTFYLSSGRTFSGGAGDAIGIQGDGGLTVGYDSGLCVHGHYEGDDGLTPAEKEEIAEYMIARWQALKVGATDQPTEHRECWCFKCHPEIPAIDRATDQPSGSQT
jgi:hypothetical protein